MSKIIVLDELPVIFTKDVNWVAQERVARQGQIILLPEDAVLATPRQEIDMDVKLALNPIKQPTKVTNSRKGK